MRCFLRVVAAFLLLGHAVAHLVGFVVAWELARFPELPFKTTILSGTIDIGTGGTRLLGAGWLLGALLFLGVAAGQARWGDPDGKGYEYQAFGGMIEEDRVVQGVTFPTRVRMGWHHGSGRFEPHGEFFRATIASASFR